MSEQQQKILDLIEKLRQYKTCDWCAYALCTDECWACQNGDHFLALDPIGKTIEKLKEMI